MSDANAVNQHYRSDEFEQRAAQALGQAGLDRDNLDWSELAAFDQFHTGGLEATKALAGLLKPAPHAAVLDIGSGLGGPARYLAATAGCQVTGLDLNPAFTRIARDFSRRSGLADKTTFIEGNALTMPFADGAFDAAFTQHVAMNIHDRSGLYREIRRVLKPGAPFAIHDIVIGNGEPVDYPMPWASTAALSHLVTAPEMRSLVTAAGFREVSSTDLTERTKPFFAEQMRAAQQANGKPQPGLIMLIGSEFAAPLANLGRQVMDGRVAIVMALYTAT
ncbi:MAG TPA: methyltransferase domain-containing protein [Thermomicrobiales bacterium]|nr:methyltransferase domain-containing protein [Thermomicrobiales bacterium]HRA47518.1 methyltransferase domain-containing protein [Thermomicrobiales bacterium]